VLPIGRERRNGWGKGLIKTHESGAIVGKRYFLHVSGFDPYDAIARYRRFVREVPRFAATWNVQAHVSAINRDGAPGSHWTVTTQAPGWQVATVFEPLDWSDIVRGELKRSSGRRLYEGLATFTEFLCTGTSWRYFTANWRYGMFFLIPFLNVFLFAALAIAAGCYAGAAIMGVVASTLWGVVGAGATAALVFTALMRWPGERWRVPDALADWVFAREYMLGRHPEMNARIEDFAARVVACARRADAQEIVIAGHSLGATVAVDVLARAFDRDPRLGRRGPRLNLLTIGATIPKLALHPRGAWLRASARRLAAEPSLTWAEFQARDDFISFHKFDPVKLARVPPHCSAPPAGDARQEEEDSPIIRRVQIHQMLNAPTLRRLRFSYMRLHYQFVMANERRAAYDYFMLMCGPAPFRQTVTQPDGPADLYDADGVYVGGTLPAAACVAG
jgi:thioesterase domain-containing protein